MTARRIHVLGASGAGVTSLGRALASELAAPHHDTDDYYWMPTDPPSRGKRPVPDRLQLMGEMFLARPDWVLSGSLDGWGDPVAPLLDLIVFLDTAMPIRMERLFDEERMVVVLPAAGSDGVRHSGGGAVRATKPGWHSAPAPC
jgi:adenylate kinase family enzyme